MQEQGWGNCGGERLIPAWKVRGVRAGSPKDHSSGDHSRLGFLNLSTMQFGPDNYLLR